MSDKEILVSIIIPMYNAELYIRKCMESICRIKRSDLEFILVDDGSTDTSLQICQEIEKEDNRIKLYAQMHKGVSCTRNFGISVSNGKWITFVDADDEINSSVYEFLIEQLDDTIPFYCLSMKHVYDKSWEKKAEECIQTLNVKYFNKEDVNLILAAIIERDKKESRIYKKYEIHFSSQCGKFYLKQQLCERNICFREGLEIGEDQLFNYQYLQYVDKIKCITNYGYFYNQNASSVMHAYKEGKKSQLLASVKAFQEVALNNKAEVAQYGIFQYLQALRMEFCHQSNKKTFCRRKEEALQLRNEKIINDCFKNGNIYKFSLKSIPLALLAKYHMFFFCDILLKIKNRLRIR